MHFRKEHNISIHSDGFSSSVLFCFDFLVAVAKIPEIMKLCSLGFLIKEMTRMDITHHFHV